MKQFILEFIFTKICLFDDGDCTDTYIMLSLLKWMVLFRYGICDASTNPW